VPEAESQAANPLSGGFLFNVNFVFVSTVASYGLAFLYVVVLARALGPEGRGVTALYQAAVNLGFALLSLGIAPAVIYFVARREQTARQALECALSVTLAAVAATALGALAVMALAGDRIEAEQVPFWLAVLAVPAVIQYRAVESVLRAQGRFGAMNALEVLLPLSILSCLLAVELTAGLTVERAVYAWSLGFVPPVVAGYALVGVAAWPRRLARTMLLLPVLRFGVQAQLSNLIQLLNYRLDTFLILLFVNAAGVGLYAVGVSLSEGMWFIANSVAVVLLTNLTAGDEAYAARMTPVVCRNTLLVTGLASIVAAIAAPVVLPAIFGRDFEDAVQPFLWLLPGTVALAGTKILAAYVFSRGRPMINAWIALATLAVTVVADLALIPLFEVSGAAAATSLSYVLSLVLTAIAYRRLSGGSIAAALLPRPADAALYVDGLRSLAARVRPSRSSSGERLRSSS
jgi:O-antigen/teichoic acid export membrane protein